MKVLLCTNTFDHVTHGPAKFSNLILGMNNNTTYPDFEIKILTEDIKATTSHVYKMNVNVPFFLAPFSQIIRMFLYARTVRRLRKEYPFDVVIYINSFFGLIDTFVPNKPYRTVGMINDDNNVDNRFSNFTWSYVWFKRFLFKPLEYISALRHDLVIVNSDYLYQKVLTTYRLKSHKVVRLYKSVDFENVQFTPRLPLQDPIKILFVKSDFKRGGIATLVNAIGLLPNTNFSVFVIGPSDQDRSYFFNLFNGVKNCNLFFLGEQPQSVVFEQLRRCDIFCVPSYKEALGVANIEALAFGIPVVTSNAGGIPEILDYGKGGWLSEPGNEKSLAQALSDCITQHSTRLQKSKEGHEFVKIHFDKQQMYSSFYAMMNALLNFKG